MRRCISIWILLCFSGLALFAQTKSEMRLSWSHPTGEFKSLYKGMASEGGNFELILFSPLSIKNLYFSLESGVYLHDLNRDFKNRVREEAAFANVTVFFPKYINVPIMVGYHYEFELYKNASLFGEVGFGFNILKVTDYTMGSTSSYSNITFPSTQRFGYKYGIGVLLKGSYSVSITYMSHGNHDFEGLVYSGNSSIYTNTTNSSMKLRSINFSIGKRL